ncbi:MAG TPA: hypothetical protein VEJ20_09040 [Candidatus Eremiobacteraceae bacterium]|nr:hypothetical protein [Candidatus Eremiobacteraceae bacterium]
MKYRVRAGLAAVACAVSLLAPVVAAAIPHADTPVTDQTADTLLQTGTLFRISMVNAISSAHSKAGDAFSFVVAEDVVIGGRVVIPKGTAGTGKVVRATPAHGGRVDGILHVQFDPVKTPDGTLVDVDITSQSLAADENDRNGTASSIAEMADIAVPGFFLIDFLRKGDDVTLAANSPFHVAVTQDAFFTPVADASPK